MNSPFGLPPDIELHLPAPLSVNRTRRLDRAAIPAMLKWSIDADALFWPVKQQLAGRKILGHFEAHVIINEKKCRNDLDNCPKILLDRAKTYGLIEDDGWKYLRKLTVEFGDAPHGAKLVLRPCE